MASENHRLETVKALLESNANPNVRNGDYEWTALHAAGFSNENSSQARMSAEIAKALLSSEANTEARNVFNYTPLHIAAANGVTPVLEVLLEAGANPYQLDKEKRSPMYLAKEEGHARAAAEIREAIAKSNPL